MGTDKVKIIVATHKQYEMPKDEIYLPLHVGAEGKMDAYGHPLDLGYVKDNTGDNISEKNPYYCELTGLYWAWKNLDCEYLGLVHYRRYFSEKSVFKQKILGNKFQYVLSKERLKILLDGADVIVPKKRRYYIESLYSHYAHTHYEDHLIQVREILRQDYPEYIDSYDRVMQQRYGYMFNMFIMKKNVLDLYCSWLFSVLNRLEQVINYKEYDTYQGRLFGRVSELLFNVWIDYQDYTIIEVPTMHMEKINWFEKGKAFLEAKFRAKKFEGSF